MKRGNRSIVPDKPLDGGTAREALENCIERDVVRRRLVQQKLEMAIRLLKEAILCLSDDLLSPRMSVTESEDSVSLNHLEVVRASARTFGDTKFTISQLCIRVAETFPGLVLDRQTVSRRLFDLREEENPAINVVTENLRPGHHSKKGRQFLYHYIGPSY